MVLLTSLIFILKIVKKEKEIKEMAYDIMQESYENITTKIKQLNELPWDGIY